MYKNKILSFFSILLCILSFSCQQDTCNEKKGDTFNSFEFYEAMNDSINQKIVVSLSYDALKDLPLNYFNDGYLWQAYNTPEGEKIDSSIYYIDSVYFDKSYMKLHILHTLFHDSVESKNFRVLYYFPDREQYIDCKHPGASDAYRIDVDFTLQKNVDAYTVKSLVWKQSYHATKK